MNLLDSAPVLVAGMIENCPYGIHPDTPIIEHNGVYAAFVEINKALATQWMQRNNNYRARSDTKEKEIGGAILRGEFELNGETIKFNDNQEVVDGQTRLSSVIAADGVIVSLVVWGVRSDKNVDMGRKRTFGDLLSHRGERNHNTLAGATRWMWKYSRKPGSGSVWQSGGVPATIAQLEQTLAQYPALRNGSTWGMRCRLMNAPALSAALYAVFCTTTPEYQVGQFFDKFHSGAGLSELDPIYSLRDRMQQNADPRTKTKLEIQEIAALFIIAFNHWKAGRTIRKGMLRWRAVGPAAQPFPEVA